MICLQFFHLFTTGLFCTYFVNDINFTFDLVVLQVIGLEFSFQLFWSVAGGHNKGQVQRSL